MDEEFSIVEAGLANANARVDDAIIALLAEGRVDLSGLPDGAAALLLCRAASRPGAPPTLVLTGDAEQARRTAANLRFFLGRHEEDEGPDPVLHYPAADTTPFLDVAPDRRGAMDRLATLFHLSHGLPWRFLVTPAPALLRRVPPREAIISRSCLVEAEGELDRDDFLRILTEGGYLRVPVAEDPGTFAVRGGIIDVYPPHSRFPARVELDDWLVLSIKLFDPDDQRTVGDIKRLFVHPVRDTILGEAELKQAREKVRNLCDEVNLPSSKTRQLLDDLESGRTFYGLDGLLPAFYPGLSTLFDFLPETTHLAVLDPTAVLHSVKDERERAREDRGAKVGSGAPVFPLEAHYMDEAELAETITHWPVAVVHRLAVGGRPDEEESPLAIYESASPDSVMRLGGEDQRMLVTELSTRRAIQGKDDALLPVAARADAWLDAGMHVLFSTRTRTQADRLVSLLRGYEVPVNEKPAPFSPSMLSGPPSHRAEVVIGTLGDGFTLATEGVVCVTEEEIFGTRAHRRPKRKKKRKTNTEPFLEDLRELAVGDFIVHSDHGVGKYLGIQRKTIAQSEYERMRGEVARGVEVLVIEYTGGDKLFLPVTRLNQVQKFSGGEGHKPKVDKLGGASFAKKKGKVAHAVRQMAEELLKLYAERAASRRPALAPPDRAYAEFEATFPFDETRDQAKAINDVLDDLEAPTPMDRLVCGDVGFGKTEVAIRAAFRAAMAGKQVAILCPTTVLAQQHYMNFRDRMESYPIEVRPLSRFVEKKEQTETLAGLKRGNVDIVVGTHRILSKDVHFADLGLLVVDEEQRFGVAHKERIKKLRANVDVLTLTATPIPRTLHLAIGGLRDLSLITTAPTDRRAVRTYALRWDDHVLKEAIEREMNRGGQVFFVYNRIEGLYERAHRLQGLLPNARIVVAHGQMKEGQLERAMTDFVEGQYDILCSTAIIESGLDIPRANTMIVDRADTFGLSQLYQLRGRVGRSRERAYCYLVTPPPSQMKDEARARIETLERFTQLGSGFQVASLDMEQRGAGDLLGASQSGNASLVGFELFVRMLEEAVAELRGEPTDHHADTELTLDVEHFLPDTYIDDVGLRLSFYKRFASISDEESMADLAAEMEDRFGPPPPEARQFVRAMSLRPLLLQYEVLGCEATGRRVALHLSQDTPLDPAKVMDLVGRAGSQWKLSPDMKLTRHFDEGLEGDSVDRVRDLLKELRPLLLDA